MSAAMSACRNWKLCPRLLALDLGRIRHHSEEITEKACSRALGAVCLLGATSAELLRVKRHKFPDAHRRPAGHPLDAVRLPVITTRPVQLAHRQKMPSDPPAYLAFSVSVPTPRG